MREPKQEITAANTVPQEIRTTLHEQGDQRLEFATGKRAELLAGVFAAVDNTAIEAANNPAGYPEKPSDGIKDQFSAAA